MSCENQPIQLVFEKTCNMCPEQYDVYYQGDAVAYVRLRWGWLIAEMGNEEIYCHKFDNEYKGEFDNEAERIQYLHKIEKAIMEVLNG